MYSDFHAEGVSLEVVHDLKLRITESTIANGWTGQHIHKRTLQGGNKYSIRPVDEKRMEQALWLLSRKMSFTGMAIVAEGGDVNGWKFGIMQSIYESNRSGHYVHNDSLQLKMDTSAGPLKDGDPGSLYYPGSDDDLHPGLNLIEMDDQPNVEFPVVLHGNALQRTSGKDVFRTFTALSRETDKSLILLASLDWSVHWDGIYDAARQEWNTGGAGVTYGKPVLLGKLYKDMRSSGRRVDIPASLLKAEAEDFIRVLKDGEWKPSNMKGDAKRGKNATFDQWV